MRIYSGKAPCKTLSSTDPAPNTWFSYADVYPDAYNAGEDIGKCFFLRDFRSELLVKYSDTTACSYPYDSLPLADLSNTYTTTWEMNESTTWSSKYVEYSIGGAGSGALRLRHNTVRNAALFCF